MDAQSRVSLNQIVSPPVPDPDRDPRQELEDLVGSELAWLLLRALAAGGYRGGRGRSSP